MKWLLMVSGVLVSFIYLLIIDFGKCPHALRRLSREALHIKYLPAEDIRFRGVPMAGYGQGPRGSRFGFGVATSTDCVKVGWEKYAFDTPEAAEEQFHEWLRLASRVLVVTNEGNSREIERAELQMPENDDFRDISRYMIILKERNSKSILSIHSESLAHAILYEKQQKFDLRTSLVERNCMDQIERLSAASFPS